MCLWNALKKLFNTIVLLVHVGVDEFSRTRFTFTT